MVGHSIMSSVRLSQLKDILVALCDGSIYMFGGVSGQVVFSVAMRQPAHRRHSQYSKATAG